MGGRHAVWNYRCRDDRTSHRAAKAMGDALPMGRAGDPRDLAEAVAFLLSDRAQWITGENVKVDGGQPG